MPLVEQKLFTLSEHLRSPLVFSGVCVNRYFVLFVCFVDRVCLFVLFLLAIVLSVLLRYTDSKFSSDIFKLFLQQYFGYIEAVSFIGGCKRSTHIKPPTCCKSHAVVLITSPFERASNWQSMVIGTESTGSCKSHHKL